jgi:hypothetical protein
MKAWCIKISDFRNKKHIENLRKRCERAGNNKTGKTEHPN